MAILPTLFSPSANDASLTYLYGIFGTVNGVISAPGGATTSTQITLLGSLFTQFNTIMLAVAVLIVVYTSVIGVMNTAHEGQFMGKNWNNLWVPIRSVLGIAALVPTGSGYSGLQILMMWVIVQGIGAADTLWTTAINYYTQMGSIYAQVGVPTLEVKSSVAGLFQGLVCAKSAAATYANPISGDTDVKYYCAQTPGDSFCSNLNSETFAPTFSDPTVTQYTLGPQGACGTLSYCNLSTSCAPGATDSLACKTCQIQISVLQNTIPTLATLAEKFVKLDHDYMVYWSAVQTQAKVAAALKVPPGSMPSIPAPQFIQSYCSATNNPTCSNLPSATGDDMSANTSIIQSIYWKYGMLPDLGEQSDFISVVVNNYAGQVNQVVDEYMAALRAQSTGLNPQLQTANDSGWIVAGSYYFVISQGNANNIAAMMPITSYDFNSDTIPIGKRPLINFRNNFNAAQTLMCISQNGSNCGSSSSSVMNGPTNGTTDAINAYTSGLSNTQTDPLAQIMASGNMYLNIAEAIFWIFFALMLLLGIIAMISSLEILGTGIGVGAFPILFEMLGIFMPIVMALITWLLGMGASLAVYVPLIPFTIFTLGAIGWMISTVEAMVAGPLVALGIISPSGHHEVLGKAEPALGLLFSIFLRPSLMIFGMFAAMLISAQVMKMANAGFALIQSTSLSGGGMFKSIIVMTTYVSFTVAVLNKTFSAIYVIPERVLSWISIQVPHEGAQELAEVKGGVDKGASEAGTVGKGSMDSATGMNRAAKNIKKQKKGGAGLKEV